MSLKNFFIIRRAKKLLFENYRLLTRHEKTLQPFDKQRLKESLVNLQNGILQEDLKEISKATSTLKELSPQVFKKTPLTRFRDFIIAISLALVAAIVIRQCWFEFYNIPTGSMRPTFKENDYLVVSKSAFGINVPLSLKHFYFDEDLVHRNDTIVFSGEDMDIPNVDTMYFYLFPGKKQYTKRLMGKPGDLLYFYGGLIYGIDKNGNDISQELQQASLSKIDHIPFIQLEGRVTTPDSQNGFFSTAIIHQMNIPIAKLSMNSNGVKGEILKDACKSCNQASDLQDIWGMNDFAMVKIVDKKEASISGIQISPSDLQSSDFFLELHHHVSIKNIKLSHDVMGNFRPLLIPCKSLIPLKEEHLKELFKNLYTSRFLVKNQIGIRYGSKPQNLIYQPHLKANDGVYEFYYGTAYKVLWGGLTKKIPNTDPLYSPENIKTLFNMGIDWDIRFTENGLESFMPHRYAYFKDGDLYVMGAPIFNKTDPILINFIQSEINRQINSPKSIPYFAFKDPGIPSAEKIKNFGLQIPEKEYLALGDNPAMSSDSRDFGFVPEKNLKGKPIMIFWPFGDRFGRPNQPPQPLMSFPNVLIWGSATIIISAWYIIHRRKHRLPLDI